MISQIYRDIATRWIWNPSANIFLAPVTCQTLLLAGLGESFHPDISSKSERIFSTPRSEKKHLKLSDSNEKWVSKKCFFSRSTENWKKNSVPIILTPWSRRGWMGYASDMVFTRIATTPDYVIFLVKEEFHIQVSSRWPHCLARNRNKLRILPEKSDENNLQYQDKRNISPPPFYTWRNKRKAHNVFAHVENNIITNCLYS